MGSYSELAIEYAIEYKDKTPTGANLVNSFFGTEAKQTSKGKGKYPTIAQAVYGTKIKAIARKQACDVLITPQHRNSQKFRDCEREAHVRTVRMCNQILAEANHTNLYKLKIDCKEAKDKLTSRLKKASGRGEYCIYMVLPQELGTYAVIHNREKEGGLNLEEITENYDKAILYGLIKPLSITPAGAKIQHSEGFGRSYRGSRGDGRKKDNANAFEVETVANPLVIAGLLGVNLSKQLRGKLKTSSGAEVLAIFEELERTGAIMLGDKRGELEQFLKKCP